MLDMRLRKKKLRVKGMTSSGCEERIEEALRELEGVKNVHADYKTGKLKLEYDVIETSLKEIEPHIENLGYHLSSRLGRRILRAAFHEGDKTARENYLASRTSGGRLNCCDLNQNKTFKRR